MADTTVFIVGEDPDFTQTLAEQVKNELGLTCHMVTNAADIGAASVIVTTEPVKNDGDAAVILIRKKPIYMNSLLDDIHRAVQKNASDESVLLGRGYRLQPRLKLLALGEKTTDLTDKEMKLLQCLAEALGQMVPKDQLLKDVWGIDSVLDTHTLETHIYRLRSKFRELADDDRMIAAEAGGYALIL